MSSAHTATSGKRRLALALTAVAVIAVSACESSGAATGTKLSDPDVVVAAVPATGALGLFIAEQRGYFTDAGLNVKVEPTASAATSITELLHGQVQVTLGQWTSAIGLEASGVQLRAVASGNNGGPDLEILATLAGSHITTLADLVGKRVAVNVIGGLSQMLVESALRSAGVDPARVRFVVAPFPAMAGYLVSDKADAAFMVEPYTSQAEINPGLATLTDLDSGSTQDFPITGYFATAAWVKKDPATFAAFQGALERGQAVAATDRLADQQAAVRFLGISAPTASVMSLGAFPVGVDPAQLVRVADLMQANKQLAPTVNATALVAKLSG